MISTWMLVVVTACTTALATAALMVFFLRRVADARIEAAGEVLSAKVRSAVEEAVEQVLPRFRSEVAGGLEEAASRVLPKLRAEVENGVRDAAGDVLPDLRDEVREGFSEALASAVTGGILGKAGDELVRKGGGVLDLILGKPSDRDD